MSKPVPTPQQIMAARSDLKRRLESFAREVRVENMLRVGSGSRPHVANVVVDGVECVVKDHQGCDRWFAMWLGPILSRREVRALQRLDGVTGVPRVLNVLDRRAFTMSRIDAKPYRGSDLDARQWREFFEQMVQLVRTMHDRGVAHCDLRSPDNTLITSKGAPAVVDFVASYTRGAAWNPWSRWVFARLCEVDYSAIEKQKRTVCPELQCGVAAYRGTPVIGPLARNLGVGVRKLARLLFTGGRRG
jgi:predicted Ser/Thr protein kinase